jgi:hypothetical protein
MPRNYLKFAKKSALPAQPNVINMRIWIIVQDVLLYAGTALNFAIKVSLRNPPGSGRARARIIDNPVFPIYIR